MAQIEKFIKVTQEQYNTLQAGGTVGSHTGINPNFIYFVENNGSSEGGTVVEADSSDDATDTLTTLKVGDITYSVPSGSGTISLEPIYKEVNLDNETITFTEEEYERLSSNLGTVVMLDWDGELTPLTPTNYTLKDVGGTPS
jgi:hypothetical protein